MSARDRNTERIDWGQLMYPGPRPDFSDDQLARGGTDRPSRSFLIAAAVNLVSCLVAALQLMPVAVTGWVLGLTLAALFPAYHGAMWLWRRPTRRRLLLASLAAMALFLAVAFVLRALQLEPQLFRWIVNALAALSLACAMGFWIITLFRAHQIQARLRELDERERAIAMARQLATAQIQPHFLFNSLASMQHWVDSGDARAATLLRALTGYLRATLPLFQRDQLTLGEELAAIERYLEVMQTRLGERLRFTLDIAPAALDQRLPPGLLLTLVENAIEHGVLPSLHGAELHIVAHRDHDRTRIEVIDSGVGLPTTPQDGVGLTNSRSRLAQAWDDSARLTLQRRPEGGTIAGLDLPLYPLTHAPTHTAAPTPAQRPA